MSASTEHSSVVTEMTGDQTGNTRRGEQIRRRRMANGMSVRELHEQSGVSREAITGAEAGRASALTYSRLESWLDRFDVETGNDQASELRPVGDPASDLVEFTIEGNFGVRAVVKGPVRDLPALQAAVAQILADMQHGGDVREEG